MNLRQKQAIEAYKRAMDFVNEHPLEPPATYGAPKGVLHDVITRLSSHSTTQSTHGRKGLAETRRQKALKRVLREVHLRPISQIARAVLREAPGIEAALRIPDRQMPVTRLVADALGVRNAVQPYEPVFVTNGSPPDFLDQLDTAITLLAGSLQDRARNAGTKAGARVGIDQEIRRGRSAVQILDAVVTRQFAYNEDVLAHWRSAKRVRLLGWMSRSGAVSGAEDEPLRAA